MKVFWCYIEIWATLQSVLKYAADWHKLWPQSHFLIADILKECPKQTVHVASVSVSVFWNYFNTAQQTM